jgi:hypothetical protein
MRRLKLLLTSVLALGLLLNTTDALASGGLPLLCDLQAGPYSVALHNDSPSLVVGRNTLTLELPAEAEGRDIQLSLVGAGGEILTVGLHRVTVLGGGTTKDMPGMEGMEMALPTEYLLRGTANLPNAGAWRARVEIIDTTGTVQSAEQDLSAVNGGPNRIYLAATGTLIVGSLLVGVIGRRRLTTARAG